MKTEKNYKARHNHPFLKEGLSIQIVESSRVYTWKNNQWTFTHIESKGDFDFWSLHKDSFGNICPNLEHWQLVKENKDFEIGKFYKYKDSFGTLVFQIRNKVGDVYFVDTDSSIGFNEQVGSFVTDSIIYRNSVEATKEDIEYCLKEKAKEKGLYKGKKCYWYFDSFICIKYIDDNIENLKLEKQVVYGNGQCFLKEKSSGDILWWQNEGWIVEPIKELEYIVTVEGEKKYKGDIVYIVKDNYEVKRVKLVDDGEGDEKIDDKKIFSEWHNAMEYRIKKLMVLIIMK